MENKSIHPILSVVEGEALRLLECLLEQEKRGAPGHVLKIETPSPLLLSAAQERLSKTATRFLFAGGIKEQQVLREGRRTEGRIWDPHMNQGFQLRFTDATYQFWLGACQTFALLSNTDASNRQQKKLLRDVLPDIEWTAGTGDWIFLVLAYQNLEKFHLYADAMATISRRMRLASPLLALMTLERDASDPELLRHFRVLTRPGSVRIVECTEERLLASWTKELSSLYELQHTFEHMTSRWEIVYRVLRTYLDALDEARRLDLALPVLRLIFLFQKKYFSQGADAVRVKVAAWSAVRTIHQRDGVLAAMARFMSLGVWVLQRRDFLAAQRYGDERYEEGQVFVRRVDALNPPRAELETNTRALTGVVG